MGQLFFKKALQAAIRSGAKTTTIRRWARPMLKPGGRAWSPGLGFLDIETVEPVDLAALTDDDAQADGFATLALLREMLAELYPEQASDGKRWFRVSFRAPTQSAGECGAGQKALKLPPLKDKASAPFPLARG